MDTWVDYRLRYAPYGFLSPGLCINAGSVSVCGVRTFSLSILTNFCIAHLFQSLTSRRCNRLINPQVQQYIQQFIQSQYGHVSYIVICGKLPQPWDIGHTYAWARDPSSEIRLLLGTISFLYKSLRHTYVNFQTLQPVSCGLPNLITAILHIFELYLQSSTYQRMYDKFLIEPHVWFRGWTVIGKWIHFGNHRTLIIIICLFVIVNISLCSGIQRYLGI